MNKPTNCIFNPNDPFETDARMPAGPFQGQCLNSNQQRSVKILTETEAEPYGPIPGWLMVANVSHQRKFWVAKIPPNPVEDVIFHIEYFPAVVPAAHTQLRFHLKPGSEIILVPQATDEPPQEVHLSEIVYSVEAVTTPGTSYDVVAGIRDYFGLAYRLVSLEDRVQLMILEKQHRVEQLKLIMSPEHKQKILENAIFVSDQAGLQFMYNSFTRNCTNELFKIIDKSIDYQIDEGITPKELFLNIPTGEFIARLLQDGTLAVATFQEMASELIKHLIGTGQLEEKGLDDPLISLTDWVPTASKISLKLRGLLSLEGESNLPDLNQEVAESNA